MVNVRRIIRECIREVLTEGALANNTRAARNWIRENGDMRYVEYMANMARTHELLPDEIKTRMRNVSDIEAFIFTVVNNVPALKLCKYRFLLAGCRMTLAGELGYPKIVLELNECIRYICKYDEYENFDRDLNGMSAQEIVDEYMPLVKEWTRNDKERLKQMKFDQIRREHNYEIVPIATYREAAKLQRWAPDWCICNGEFYYSQYAEQDNYDSEPEVMMYALLRDDFKTVPRESGETTPFDDYGLSMLCVRVKKEDGRLRGVTTRWNHLNGGNDDMMDPEELSNLIGANFYEVMKGR